MKTRMRMTLVDWIVVAVCMVLVTLTLGATGSTGRRRAKELICLSNLRQWGKVFQDYVEHNDGRFFTGDDHTPGRWWPKQLDEAQQDWEQTKIWFCPEATRPMYDEQGNIAPTLDPFVAWGIHTGPDLRAHRIAGSYGLNGYTIIPKHAFDYYGNGVSTDEGWRVATVKGGAKIPWFVDALRFDLWPTRYDSPAESEFAAWSSERDMARCCINRHNGAVNCLFLDGSVRKVGLKELWTLKWHKSFDTRGPWTIAGGALPEDWPQWMRNFKDY